MFAEYPDVIQWQCDGCGLTLEFPPRSFWSGLDEIKARGWQICRDDDGWDHRCSKCKRSSASILDMKPKKVSG
jgi:hypothetical protein